MFEIFQFCHISKKNLQSEFNIAIGRDGRSPAKNHLPPFSYKEFSRSEFKGMVEYRKVVSMDFQSHQYVQTARGREIESVGSKAQ